MKSEKGTIIYMLIPETLIIIIPALLGILDILLLKSMDLIF